MKGKEKKGLRGGGGCGEKLGVAGRAETDAEPGEWAVTRRARAGDPLAARRCPCARRCCRSCGTPCPAARRLVPAGAGARGPRPGPCSRCAPSARCASATASSTRPARAETQAARMGALNASWTTLGRQAGPGPSPPPPAPTCASARSAGASRRCGRPGPARPRVAWEPPPRPPVRPGRDLARASSPSTSDHGTSRCRDGPAPGSGRPASPASEEPDLCPGGRPPRFCLGFRVKSEARSGACLRPLLEWPECAADPALCPPLRTRGAQELRTPGAGDCGVIPGSGQQSARKTLSWDCSGSQDWTQLPLLEEGLWADGCPLAPLASFFSLFWGEKLRNFYETPPRERVSWALIPPPATPQSRWNKKRTKPPNRGYPELISWDREGIKGLDHPGSLLKNTDWMVTFALSILGPAHSQQVSPGPGSWPVSTDLSGQGGCDKDPETDGERCGDLERRRHQETQKDRNQMGLGEGRTRELFGVAVPGGPCGGGVCLGRDDWRLRNHAHMCVYIHP